VADLELSKKLLSLMIYARGVDEAATRLCSRGFLSLWPSCLGQEAAQVGSIVAVGDDAYVFPSYREHAAALARGITPNQLLHQWTARSFCGWSSNSVNFHPYTVVVAGHLLHAVGYAMGLRMKGSSKIVLAYFGDGATSQGDFSEALNLAAVKGVSVLFFCQNNGWAISTPVRNQMKTSVADRARGFGVEAVTVDGNNVFDVYDSTIKAVDFMRTSSAPFLIEALTMRISGHTTTDAPDLYRSSEDVEYWVDLDPIKRAIEHSAHVPGFCYEWLQTTKSAVDSFCDNLGRTDRSGECLDDKSSVFDMRSIR
jgi:2-oxoisovalerate dehydrogenase E1 component alpha subunit